jgi:hypothetical protein
MSEMHSGGANRFKVLDRSYQERRILTALSWVLIVLTNGALFYLIVHSPDHSIYDETWFIDTLDILRRHGFTRAFLLEYPGSPGPTFTVIYTGIQNVLHLSYPWLRLVNFVFLLGTAFLLWPLLCAIRTFSLGKPSGVDAALLAAAFTALPAVGVSGGMTLTEMPAIFIMLIFLIGLSLLLKFENRILPALMLSVLCGATIAAAIMGRQNYLLVLPCLLLLRRAPGGMLDRTELAYFSTIGVVALFMVVPIFVIWGGLIPPNQAGVGSGFSIWNGVVSIGYGGIIAAVLAPQLFRILFVRWRYSVAIVICAAALVLAFGVVQLPANSVLLSIGNEAVLSLIGYGFAIVLAALSVSFLFCMGNHIWEHQSDRIVRFCGCVFILGIISNVKISVQFSSRYVIVFVPFLLLALAPTIRVNWHFPIRLAIGACISLTSLYSYYSYYARR